MSLEYEMHSQMTAVQEGIDELKQRLISSQKEIEEERNLIAGHLSLSKKNKNQQEQVPGISSSSSCYDATTRARSISLLSNNSAAASTAVNNDSFISSKFVANNNNNNNNTTNTSRPNTANSLDEQQQQQGTATAKPNEQRKIKVKSSPPPTLVSHDKLSHSLHAFPLFIAEALWRELKCETVNIYVRGKDNASNLLYSVPQRFHDPNSFKRLHRSVETAVFQHQVAVCAWDAASKQQQQQHQQHQQQQHQQQFVGGGGASFSATGGASSSVFGVAPSPSWSMNSGSGSGFNANISASPSASTSSSHPQSYVVWPVVLVETSSSGSAEKNASNDMNNEGDDQVDGPVSSQSQRPGTTGIPLSANSMKSRNKINKSQNPNNLFQLQRVDDGKSEQQQLEGAKYKTVACIECINKKISSYSMFAASMMSSGVGKGGQQDQQESFNNNNNNNNNSTQLPLNQMKMQFSKTDEAIIASAAKLLAACFENFPSSCSVSDTLESHRIVSQLSKIILSNVQPLPGEQPSVNIPTAVSSVESACLAMPPTKLFRGPSAGVFKPTVGHRTSNNIPSSPYALANSTRESKALSIDSFTHDGNLRSLEASISYLDSMWKAAFTDNVGMHEECRKLSTKIRDLSFICSQVEECFAAARKMNAIDDIRSFLRTAELSLKSGSRALLGTAMKISLESQINSDDDDRNEKRLSSCRSNSSGSLDKSKATKRKDSRSGSGSSLPFSKASNGQVKPTPPPPPPPTLAQNSTLSRPGTGRDFLTTSFRQQQQQQRSQQRLNRSAMVSRFFENDTIAISDIHIDGPEGLRHYTVDPASKRAQMAAIERTVNDAVTEAKNYLLHSRAPHRSESAGDIQWLRHHNQQQQQQQQHSQQNSARNNISTQNTLPKASPTRP